MEIKGEWSATTVVSAYYDVFLDLPIQIKLS